MTQPTNPLPISIDAWPAEDRLTYVETHIEQAEDKRVLLDIGVAALIDESLTRPLKFRLDAAETLMNSGNPGHNDRNIIIEAWKAACLEWAKDERTYPRDITRRLNAHTKDNGKVGIESPFAEAAAEIDFKIKRGKAVAAAVDMVRKILPKCLTQQFSRPSDSL